MALTKKFVGTVATVFNGNSFVGRNLLSRLGAEGSKVVIAHRGSEYSVQPLRVVGGLGQVYFSHYNLKDEMSLRESMKYSNVVVNCIGSEKETKNFSFNEVHVEGPRRMARIAREAGVEKFIHFSALNANPNPTPWFLKTGSRFLKSKYHGELAVLEEFPDAIIFRPADILGDGDNFLVHFTEFIRCVYTTNLAIWDYYDGVVKQPVYIKDVVDGLVRAIQDDSLNGKIIQAVGPYRYNFYDLIEYMRCCVGRGQKFDDGEIYNLRWHLLTRMAMFFSNLIFKKSFLPYERVERDCITDFVDPNLLTLKDIGVNLTPLEDHIMSLGLSRPRYHRVYTPYETKLQIDLPKKLNVA